MKKNYKRCPRCGGQKCGYAFGNGFSLQDFGGKKIDCPLCLGAGEIKTLEAALEEFSDIPKSTNAPKKPKIKKGITLCEV